MKYILLLLFSLLFLSNFPIWGADSINLEQYTISKIDRDSFQIINKKNKIKATHKIKQIRPDGKIISLHTVKDNNDHFYIKYFIGTVGIQPLWADSEVIIYKIDNPTKITKTDKFIYARESFSTKKSSFTIPFLVRNKKGKLTIETNLY